MIQLGIFWRTLPVSLALGAMLAPAPARAEGFFDLYLGAAFPQTEHVDVHADDPTINNNPSFQAAYAPSPCVGCPPDRDFDWETSPSFGMRGGYWIETTPSIVGLALDLSYYRIFEKDEFASLNMWAVPMTPLLMVRVPIGYSERFPGGRIQPYAAVGPGFTIAAAHADLSNLGIGLDDFADATFDVGLDARAGLAVQLARHFGIFGEYRYTYLKPHFQDKVDDAFGAPDFEAKIDIKPKLSTHHVVFGIRFSF